MKCCKCKKDIPDVSRYCNYCGREQKSSSDYSNLIPISEYAELHGVSASTVKKKILTGTMEGIKIGRNWCLEKDTPYVDNRVKTGEYRDWRKKHCKSEIETGNDEKI